MPQKIKNKEILKYIDKLERTTAKLMLLIDSRERMNRGFAVLMDNEYGADEWVECNYKTRTIVTKTERDELAFVMKNNRIPPIVETELPSDVSVVETPAEETKPTEH